MGGGGHRNIAGQPDLLCYSILISNPIAKTTELFLDRLRPAGVVDDTLVGVLLTRSESHQPPPVIRRHIESESGRNIALHPIMEADKRLSQPSGVAVGEPFSPQLDSTLEPYLVDQAAP